MSDTDIRAMAEEATWLAGKLPSECHCCTDSNREKLVAIIGRLAAVAEAARNSALEEAAAICEGMRDLTEAKRAQKAADEALSEGDESEALHRLRHCNSVSLFNGALERAARDIRAAASIATQAGKGME